MKKEIINFQRENSYQVERYVYDNSFYRKLLAGKYGQRYLRYRQLWEQTVKGEMLPKFPLHIDLDTVDNCNLKCPDCQEVNTRIRTCIKMHQELVDGIFHEISHYDVCALNIGAIGEPLLEKEMVLYVLAQTKKTAIMETFLHTNGQLLDREISEQLLQTDLTYLCISVDATTEATYRKVRGGDFTKLRDNIYEFVSLRRQRKQVFPLLRLSFLMQQENREEKGEFIKMWSDIADLIDYQPLIRYRNFNKKPAVSISPCFTPWNRLMIAPTGDICVCCCGIAFNDDVRLGFFPKTSIYDAWNGSKIKRLRESMLHLRLEEFPTCLDCLLRR